MDARLLRRQTELRVLLRRQIHHDQPIHAGCLGILQEPLHAILIDGIVIAHEDDGRACLAGAKPAHQAKRRLHAAARRKRPQRGGLDRGAIGHGIAEGHAELDQIGAGGRQRLHDLARGRGIGIACGDEGDKGRPPGALQLGKARIDAIVAHSFVPRCLAAAKISLSPRPQRLTTIR